MNKITDKIVSIPPFISTSWDNVTSLHMDGLNIIFTMKDGKKIAVPNLAGSEIELIFASHASFMEKKEKPEKRIGKDSLEQIFTIPIGLTKDSLESIGQALQHNESHRNLPTLPPEMLNKISSLSKMMTPEDIEIMEAPHPGCNCVYCQITRTLQQELLKNEILPDHPDLITEEEKVSDEDLHFEEWNIELIKDKMYKVTNKLAPEEHYTVYLGEPIGCTCGKANCEHIIAVLRS